MNGFRGWLITFIHQTVTGSERIRLLLTPLFAVFFFCLILFAIGASFFMDRFFGFPEFIPKAYGRAVSLPFLIIGTSLWIWSVWKFLKTKGTPVPVNPPPKLVTDGPYAYSRNPMLTGVFLLNIISASVCRFGSSIVLSCPRPAEGGFARSDDGVVAMTDACPKGIRSPIFLRSRP